MSETRDALAVRVLPRQEGANRTGGTGRSIGLDAVRSIAILLVLFSHCGLMFASWVGTQFPAILAVSGLYGVELFFVLSGYLIGQLLFEIIEREISWGAWLRFMSRRWMRTLPLYAVCLAVSAMVWPPHFWEPGHAYLRRDLLYYGTLTQNLAWPMVDGWLAVTWSLTIEEWFYLLFSSLLLTTAVFFSRKTAVWCSVAIFITIPTLLRWQVPDTIDWNEVTRKIVVYRLDAIAFGIVAAHLGDNRRISVTHRLLGLAAGMSLVALTWAGGLFSVFHLPLHVERTFIFTFVSFGFALCLPAAAAWKETRSRSLRFCAGATSSLSYSLYLVHLTVLEMVGFYRHAFPGWVCAGLFALLLSLGLSVLCHRLIERPIMRLRPKQFT